MTGIVVAVHVTLCPSLLLASGDATLIEDRLVALLSISRTSCCFCVRADSFESVRDIGVRDVGGLLVPTLSRLNTMSLIDKMPCSLLSSSTTGIRRTRACSNILSASRH